VPVQRTGIFLGPEADTVLRLGFFFRKIPKSEVRSSKPPTGTCSEDGCRCALPSPANLKLGWPESSLAKSSCRSSLRAWPAAVPPGGQILDIPNHIVEIPGFILGTILGTLRRVTSPGSGSARPTQPTPETAILATPIKEFYNSIP
jgi:hypothetical protein